MLSQSSLFGAVRLRTISRRFFLLLALSMRLPSLSGAARLRAIIWRRFFLYFLPGGDSDEVSDHDDDHFTSYGITEAAAAARLTGALSLPFFAFEERAASPGEPRNIFRFEIGRLSAYV